MYFYYILANVIHFCRLTCSAALGGFGMFFLIGSYANATIFLLGSLNLLLAIAIYIFDRLDGVGRRSL